MGNPRKTWIDNDLLTSKAWLSLSKTAKDLLGLFWTKRQMEKMPDPKNKRKGIWTMINNGEIVFTYREAKEKWGIYPDRFNNGIDQLCEKGFLEITRPGAPKLRLPALFALSDRWKKYGKPDFEKIQRRKQYTPPNKGNKRQ